MALCRVIFTGISSKSGSIHTIISNQAKTSRQNAGRNNNCWEICHCEPSQRMAWESVLLKNDRSLCISRGIRIATGDIGRLCNDSSFFCAGLLSWDSLVMPVSFGQPIKTGPAQQTPLHLFFPVVPDILDIVVVFHDVQQLLHQGNLLLALQLLIVLGKFRKN